MGSKHTRLHTGTINNAHFSGHKILANPPEVKTADSAVQLCQKIQTEGICQTGTCNNVSFPDGVRSTRTPRPCTSWSWATQPPPSSLTLGQRDAWLYGPRTRSIEHTQDWAKLTFYSAATQRSEVERSDGGAAV